MKDMRWLSILLLEGDLLMKKSIHSCSREPMYERFGMAKFLYQTNQLICRPKPLEKQAINFNIFPLENIEDIYPLDEAVTGSDRKQILKWFFETSDKSYLSKNEQGEIDGYTMGNSRALGSFYSEF